MAKDSPVTHPDPDTDASEAPTDKGRATAALPPLPDDVAGLGYEAARDELTSIVAALESGRVGLEESMTLWQRGELLARHCESWLDAAEAKLRG